MAVRGAQAQITEQILAWEDVTAHPHRFGGTEYRLGRREIGHIHGDHMVDVPFPVKVRERLVAAGQAAPHHLLPETGWVSFYLREPGDAGRAVALLRESYELAVAQQAKRSAPPASP